MERSRDNWFPMKSVSPYRSVSSVRLRLRRNDVTRPALFDGKSASYSGESRNFSCVTLIVFSTNRKDYGLLTNVGFVCHRYLSPESVPWVERSPVETPGRISSQSFLDGQVSAARARPERQKGPWHRGQPGTVALVMSSEVETSGPRRNVFLLVSRTPSPGSASVGMT